MANIKSAEKQARQSVVRRDRNNKIKSAVRSAEKKVRTAMASGDKGKLTDLLKAYSSALDSAAQKGIYHKATAARKISRIYTAANPKAK